MGFIYFLLILFASLIVLTLISTIIKLALFITIRYVYDTRLLIIPSLLTIATWCVMAIGWFYTVTHVLNIDLSSFAFNLFMIKEQTQPIITPLWMTALIFGIIGMIFQAFSYFTVNIDYIKINGNIRMFFKKLLHIEPKKDQITTGIAVDTRPDNLTFGNAFIASLFAFTFIVLFIFILLYAGHFLSVALLK